MEPDIARRRLRAQRLSGEPFKSAIDAVRWLGAVQAQDYPAAKWALGMRTEGATDAAIDRLFDEGAILRTHVMRPTWHFVLPADIRRLLELTAPRVRAGVAGRHRQLELDERTIAQAEEVFRRTLEGRHLTRAELGEALTAAGISPAGQRLPHLLHCGELDRVITSGPRKGKQHTFALLDERVPPARPFDREEALADLTLRYFRSHGPAQLQDFAWWSGLTMADAREGVRLAGDALVSEDVDGRAHWSAAGAEPPPDDSPIARLLPNFDELFVAYRDRSAALFEGPALDPFLVLGNVATIDGRVRGTWRRVPVGASVRLELRPLGRLDRRETAAVEEAARGLGRFLEAAVESAWI